MSGAGFLFMPDEAATPNMVRVTLTQGLVRGLGQVHLHVDARAGRLPLLLFDRNESRL